LEQRSAALNELISTELWDPRRNVFAARRWSGEFSSSLTPTSFYPMLCGAATPAQQSALIEEHLRNPGEFWGERVLPASTFDDPATSDNVYWRGRVWGPHLMLVWEGLRRNGAFETATALADAAWRMFEPAWTTHRRCMENYHVHPTGPDESADADPFYTWGALCALLRCLDAADQSPWGGLVFAPGERAGELVTPGRWWQTEGSNRDVCVRLNGAPLLRARDAGRLWVDCDEYRVSVRPDATASISIEGVTQSNIVHGAIDDSPVHVDVATPVTVEGGSRLVLWLREPLGWGGSR
jgi:putative isomerase